MIFDAMEKQFWPWVLVLGSKLEFWQINASAYCLEA